MKNPITDWRNYKHVHRLVGNQCIACNKKNYPKKYLCECGSQEFSEVEFSDKGVLLTFTKTDSIILGIVELDEGIKILTQIVETHSVGDYEKLSIGMTLRAVFRKLSDNGEAGIILYGIKFSAD